MGPGQLAESLLREFVRLPGAVFLLPEDNCSRLLVLSQSRPAQLQISRILIAG